VGSPFVFDNSLQADLITFLDSNEAPGSLTASKKATQYKPDETVNSYVFEQEVMRPFKSINTYDLKGGDSINAVIQTWGYEMPLGTVSLNY